MAAPVQGADGLLAIEALAAEMESDASGGFTGDRTVAHERAQLRSGRALPSVAPRRASKARIAVIVVTSVVLLSVVALAVVGMMTGDRSSDSLTIPTRGSEPSGESGSTPTTAPFEFPVVVGVSYAEGLVEVSWTWAGDPDEPGIVRLVTEGGAELPDYEGEPMTVALGDGMATVEAPSGDRTFCAQVGWLFTDESGDPATLLSELGDDACL